MTDCDADDKPLPQYEEIASESLYFGFLAGATAALTGAAAGFALPVSTFFFNFCVFFGLLSPMFQHLLYSLKSEWGSLSVTPYTFLTPSLCTDHFVIHCEIRLVLLSRIMTIRD